MAAARIAAILGVILSVPLAAQPNSQCRLGVQVQDGTGAVIPGAQIEVSPSTSGPAESDGTGRACFDLPAGSYTISVSSKWFKNLRITHVPVSDSQDQLIVATLQVRGSGPECCSRFIEIDIQRDYLTIEIPDQPLRTLEPLPSRRWKRRL